MCRLGGIVNRRPFLDLSVRLGVDCQLPDLLKVYRVGSEVANKRRRHLQKNAWRPGKTPSKRHVALADFKLWVTHAPPERLSLNEALVLKGVRWQIER